MKESIFDKKLKDPKFKSVYDRVAMKLSIGEEIARLRHQKHMTQLALAKKVHTSRTAIARYESGNYTRYSLITLLRIAQALRASLSISLIPFHKTYPNLFK